MVVLFVAEDLGRLFSFHKTILKTLFHHMLEYHQLKSNVLDLSLKLGSRLEPSLWIFFANTCSKDIISSHCGNSKALKCKPQTQPEAVCLLGTLCLPLGFHKTTPQDIISHGGHSSSLVGNVLEPAVSTATESQASTVLVVTVTAECQPLGLFSLLIYLPPLKVVHFFQVPASTSIQM